MQSVSASFGSRMVRRTREGLPGGVVWTAGLLFLLTLAIAKSTVTAQWVPGFASWPSLHGSHPGDALGLGLVNAWWGRILDGSAIADSSFDLYLISWLM